MTAAKLYDIDVEQFLYDSVSIDRQQIKEEFLKVAPQYAYWNERYAEAQRDEQRAGLALKALAARVHVQERTRLIAEAPEDEVGTGKNVRVRKKLPNADDVNQAVEGREDVQQARRVQAEAEIETRRLAGVVQAVRTKKDMLIAYGGMVREEMRGDPSVRDEMREGTQFREGGDGGWRSRQAGE